MISSLLALRPELREGEMNFTYGASKNKRKLEREEEVSVGVTLSHA